MWSQTSSLQARQTCKSLGPTPSPEPRGSQNGVLSDAAGSGLDPLRTFCGVAYFASPDPKTAPRFSTRSGTHLARLGTQDQHTYEHGLLSAAVSPAPRTAGTGQGSPWSLGSTWAVSRKPKVSSYFQFPFTEKNPFRVTKTSLPGCGRNRENEVFWEQSWK